jgi:TonB family protein
MGGAGTPSMAAPAPRRGAWRLLLVVLVNLCLVGGSAWMAYALLQRYRTPPPPTVLLGIPRQVELDAGRAPPPAPDLSAATATPKARAPAPKGKGGKRVASPGKAGVPADVAPGATKPTVDVAGPGGTKPGADDHDDAPSEPASRPAAPAPVGPAPTRAAEGDADGAETAGTLNADNVSFVVRHYLPQVRSCYERALKQQDPLSGIVEVKFEVSGEGRVKSSTVNKNSTGHDGLGRCIAAVLKTWKFPRPVGGGSAVFIYPFVFSSPGE